MEHIRDVHSRFKGWIRSSAFRMNERSLSRADRPGQLAPLIPRLLLVFHGFGYERDQTSFASIEQNRTGTPIGG